MSSISIEITTPKLVSELGTVTRIGHATQPSDARDMCTNLAALFERIAAGMETASITVGMSSSDAVAAWGTLTLSSGSGVVGGTIAGVTKTVTWATSDTASAAALVAAINADATLNKLVVASSAAGVVTVTTLDAGVLGNQVTLVASGTGVTAGHVVSGKLTGGTGGDAPAVTYVRQ